MLRQRMFSSQRSLGSHVEFGNSFAAAAPRGIYQGALSTVRGWAKLVCSESYIRRLVMASRLPICQAIAADDLENVLLWIETHNNKIVDSGGEQCRLMYLSCLFAAERTIRVLLIDRWQVELLDLVATVDSGNISLIRIIDTALPYSVDRSRAAILAARRGCENTFEFLEHKSTTACDESFWIRNETVPSGCSSLSSVMTRAYRNDAIRQLIYMAFSAGTVRNVIKEVRKRPRELWERALDLEDQRVAKWLTFVGINPNVHVWYGVLPLVVAANRKLTEFSLALIEGGADVDVRENGADTVLHIAVLYGDRRLIRAVLQSCKSVDLAGRKGRTALHVAVMNGDSDVIKELLLRCKFINRRDHDGNTALHVAVNNRDEICTKLLIEGGASLAVTDSHGTTALGIACEARDDEFAKFMLKAGARADAGLVEYQPCLVAAVRAEDSAMVGLLLRKGASLSTQDCNGTPVIIIAFMSEYCAIWNLFIDAKGVNLMERNREGQTALHIAVGLIRRCAVEVLLGAGADVNARDHTGETPLSCAIGLAGGCVGTDRAELVMIVELLVNYDADVTRVIGSARSRFPEVVQCLESRVIRLIDGRQVFWAR